MIDIERPKISVCIPAYSMNGNGAIFLDQLFLHLAHQTFQDFEVVVSDQSSDTAVVDVCRKWQRKLPINHLWNTESKGSSSINCNNAIDFARGETIKVLFQDDFLWSKHALERVYSVLSSSDSEWALCGSGVSIDGKAVTKPMVPRLNSRICFGNNTVSSPSVLAFRASCKERFDEELIWLMDVELYYRFHQHYGPPAIAEELLVANRLHDGQVSASIDREIQIRELKYVWAKHGMAGSLAGLYEYSRRRLKLMIPR